MLAENAALIVDVKYWYAYSIIVQYTLIRHVPAVDNNSRYRCRRCYICFSLVSGHDKLWGNMLAENVSSIVDVKYWYAYSIIVQYTLITHVPAVGNNSRYRCRRCYICFSLVSGHDKLWGNMLAENVSSIVDVKYWYAYHFKYSDSRTVFEEICVDTFCFLGGLWE